MDFGEASELVRSIEGGALEYEPPEAGKPVERKRIEFSPQEFAEMSYSEALALNARVDKVIAGAAMLRSIYGEEAPPPAPEVKPPEEKVQAVVEAIVPKKEVPAPEIEMERPAEAVEERPAKEVIEFEGKAPAGEIEFEVMEEAKAPPAPAPPAPPVEMEAERPAPPPEARAVPEVSLRIPPVLMGSPAESAAETVEKLGKQFASEVKAGKRVDKKGVKKRMLELTRELFREKSVDRREEIKKEIVALKNILTEAEGKAKPKADIFTVVKNDQDYDLAAAKKAVNDAYEHALKPLLKYFDEEAALDKGAEAFVELEKKASELKDQVSALANKYEDYLVQKHTAEFGEIVKMGKATEAMEERNAKVQGAYRAEFTALKESVWSEIDAAVEKRKGEAPAPAAGMSEEEELLAYLQAEEPLDYERYVRGEMTRVEALAEARRKRAARRGEE